MALGAAATVLTLGLQPAAQAASGTLYVGVTNCSDSGPASQTQPLCTLAKAATMVSAGTTVQVMKGTYAGDAKITASGTSSARIVFQAASGVTINSGTNGFWVSGADYVTIKGFHITGTTSNGIKVVSGYANQAVTLPDHVTIADNDISNTAPADPNAVTQPGPAAGLYLQDTTYSTVSGNTVHDNHGHGIQIYTNSAHNTISGNRSYRNAYGNTRNANGILVTGSDNTLIRNVTYDNEDSGIQLYPVQQFKAGDPTATPPVPDKPFIPGADRTLVTLNVTYGNGDHGIDDLDVADGRIIGNTVVGNCTTGINVEGNSSGYVVENNVAADNGLGCPNRRQGNIGVWDGAATATGADATTVDYNVTWITGYDGSQTTYGWGLLPYKSLADFQKVSGQAAHDVFADPKFLNAATKDFHIVAGSPAIDMADSAASGEQTKDFDGNGRLDDPAVADTGVGPRTFDDAGAYEYQAAPAPTAKLAVTPSTGITPLTVTANAAGSTGTGLSYAFDWGDGATTAAQAGATAQHTYTKAGTFTVTVTVKDSRGLTATATASVSPVAPQAPKAALTVTPASGSVPLAVTADASKSTDPQGETLTYAFAWGDGSTTPAQAGATAKHTYAKVGTYKVTVTVTNTSALSATATASVTVGRAATTTTLTSSRNPSITGQSVTFTATVADGAAGTPTGTVTFKDGTAKLGTGTLSGGKASLTTSSLSAGTHSVTASYDGTTTFAPSTSAPVKQVVNAAVTRLSGTDRYATAASVADQFAPGVPVAFVATGLKFPDALAGAALAGHLGGPVLLSAPTSLPTATATALSRLKPKKIIVLGGADVVSDGVKAALSKYAPTVVRMSGADRYATAAAVAGQFAPEVPVAFVATGLNFPDALAGAALAGHLGGPVLLTDPRALPQATADALAKLKPKKIVVLGQADVVGSAVATALGKYAKTVERIGGTDRYDTAAQVGKRFGTTTPIAFVATGLDFPDALAGAALAGHLGGPVLLSAPTSLPSSTASALDYVNPHHVTLLGGADVVSNAVMAAVDKYVVR